MPVPRFATAIPLLVAAALASAEGQPAPAAACGAAPTPAGHREHVLHLAARPASDVMLGPQKVDEGVRMRLTTLLNEVGAALQMPTGLTFRPGPGVAYRPSDEGHRKARDTLYRPDVRPQVWLTLRAGRGPSDVALRGSSFPELDTALVRAVRVAAEGGAGTVLAPGAVAGDSFRVVLELVTDGDAAAVSAPVSRVALPLFVGTPVAVVPDTSAEPVYPGWALYAGLEGDVLVRFEVTEAGRVDLASVAVLRGQRDFVAAVVDALPAMRFKPATLGGCPVRVTAQRPFQFRLRGRVWRFRYPDD